MLARRTVALRQRLCLRQAQTPHAVHACAPAGWRDVPAWAQALIDSNKNLSDKLTQLETEKAQATRSQQILAKAKEYGIPENYAKRCAIKDDEDLDAYFKDLKQEFANDGFKGVTPPESAEEKIEKESESIAKMIDEGTKTIVEQNKN